MKLSRVQIHNFRSIHDAKLEVFGYNLLVGPNNSGKSTVIAAVLAFYEKDGDKYKHDRDFPYIACSDEESWVELTFALSPAEDASLAENHRQQNRNLRLRKYFRGQKERVGNIYEHNTEGTLSPFYGAKNVQSGKLGDIVFIPAVSKVDEHTKLSGPSALRDLLTNVLQAVISLSPSYSKFSSDFEMFSRTIKTETTDTGQSLAGLETDLGKFLASWNSGFKLKLNAPSTAEIVKTLLSYTFTDTAHERELSADQFGSGLQRHIIYSLIQIGSSYVQKKPSKKAKDFTPNMTLILFEEPEAFLHPPQQEILAKSLAKLAGNPDHQVICSTHSSHFVSRNADHIPSLAHLKRKEGCVTIHQIDGNSWAGIVDANQAMHRISAKYTRLKKKLREDDMQPEMEAVKYSLWLDPNRCGMFFANHVLVVEGPSDQALIRKLIDDGKIKPPKDGLYILDALGKFNIHRFMKLLIHLGIEHSVLHDSDGGRDEHEDINRLIDNTGDPELTVSIVAITDNLESYLGVPETLPHRKPQHLLFYYENNRIAVDRLDAFCKLVDSCLPNSEVGSDQQSVRP